MRACMCTCVRMGSTSTPPPPFGWKRVGGGAFDPGAKRCFGWMDGWANKTIIKKKKYSKRGKQGSKLIAGKEHKRHTTEWGKWQHGTHRSETTEDDGLKHVSQDFQARRSRSRVRRSRVRGPTIHLFFFGFEKPIKLWELRYGWRRVLLRRIRL